MHKTVAPMIVLFTDFGGDGPYVGQMKAVFAQQAPGMPVIDMLHNAPRFNAQASAHLLAAYVSAFPKGSVILGVVDPSVGSAQRKPIIANIAQRWYVGPANGLFDVLAARALDAQQKVSYWEITWRPKHLSNSFHGRDLFAPVAAQLARGETPQGDEISLPVSAAAAGDLSEIIFVDHFGNVVSGLRASNVDAKARINIGEHSLAHARTFSAVPVGQGFWYENANGLVEIAVNQGNAVRTLNVTIGSRLMIDG
jgi:S-adenosyl-L-methionine hydrolase (adenosine-forming)